MKLLKNVLKTVAGIIMAAAMTIQPVMPAWSYENDSTTQETGVNIYVFNVCRLLTIHQMQFLLRTTDIMQWLM